MREDRAGVPDRATRHRVVRRLARLALTLVVLVLALALAEGAASAYLLAGDFRAASGPNTVTRPHTTYDTLLGWVNRKSFVSPNEFGRELTLTTNAQGFRDTRDLSPRAGPGEVRLVCSGDSFTLASGVADGRHWCALLERELPGLRTMNMGQGMYGLDQAYLWYRRDGLRYPHDVEVLAITDVMLERSTTGKYSGRDKPYFVLEQGRLTLRNVPVPRQSTEQLRFVYASRVIEELALMRLIRRIPTFGGRRTLERAATASFPMFERILDDLAAIHARRGSRLVIAYLPTKRDMTPGPHDAWRARLAAFSHARAITFVDLTPAMRALRPDSLDLVWITRVPAGSPTGVPGHYTNLGNLWVARMLAGRLAALPEFAHLRPTVSQAGDAR
jgi:hypothetical protein